LSNAFIASSDLPDRPKSIPLIFQAVEFCGLISIALFCVFMSFSIALFKSETLLLPELGIPANGPAHTDSLGLKASA
jgi:hypothetical protein